jgi:CubicO group peptidase (beta-lactamase class C family)
MKTKKFFMYLLAITVLAGAVVLAKYPYLMKGVTKIYLKGHKTSYISDYPEYPKRLVPNGTVKEWPLHKDYNKFSPSGRLEKWNDQFGTAAFVVIKNDSILFEKYYTGYTKDSLSNSFSMAKSIIMTLLFKAIQDGYIKSLDQKLVDFFPEFKGKYAGEVTLRHLAAMSSGSNWVENYYSPFNITAEAYFTDDLDKMILDKVSFDNPPGKKWYYSSGDTQILGMVIRKATGKTLSGYLSESFWKPMGMRKYAYWNLDREDGMEKAFCCLNSNARDFSRFGKLYLHKGNWEGKQLLDSAFVEQAVTPVFDNMPRYGLQWWIFDHNGIKGFMMRGHLGQYVMVVPDEKVIITRLGRRKPFAPMGTFSEDIFVYLEEGMNIARQTGR